MSNKKEFRKYATMHHGISGGVVDAYENHIAGMTRSIIEERPKPFREIDVFSRLIMDRIVFLGVAIDDQIANIITAQLLFLESTNPEQDITLYINSPGGGVYAGLGIYDTMQYITPAVGTICVGLAASMGAVLLTGGKEGSRAALPHSRVMIHQPLGGTRGQAIDIKIYCDEMKEIQHDIYKIIATHTGNSIEKVTKDSDRDRWMRAKEAVDYGLIDHVLTR